MNINLDILAKNLEDTSLGDEGSNSDQLVFDPPSGSTAFQSLDNIPPYLFRVVSPRSAGETNNTWARSESARKKNPSSRKDIFSFERLEDLQSKAFELTVHLQWYGHKYKVEDNFVSWTSSLLFAIQYIYYRHYHDIPKSSLDDINLYIIDTSLFKRGTFMRDLDLIESFRRFDSEAIPGQYWNLESLHSLRTKKGFYFGEYLSQGSLNISNKVQMIPANILFDHNRLLCLQPAFSKLYVSPPRKEDTELANSVMDLRKDIWAATLADPCQLRYLGGLAAIKDILDDVATHNSQLGWRFPLGIYFAALIGSGPKTGSYMMNGQLFFKYFQSTIWGGKEHSGLKDFKLNIDVSDTMPELEYAQILLREFNKYLHLKGILDTAEEAERRIRNLYIKTMWPEDGDLVVEANQNECLRNMGEQVAKKLRNVKIMCDEILSTRVQSEK